jgi:hypothetical protein
MKYFLALILFASFNGSAQDDEKVDEDEPDFYYAIESHIKTNRHLSIGIEPLAVGFMGSYIKMGVGANFDVADLMGKYSIAGNFNYGYVNYSLDKNKVDYATVEINDKLRNFDLNFNVGYTLKSETATEDWNVKLKSSGNTDYYATMPCKSTTSYSVTAGFNMSSFYSADELTVQSTFVDPFNGVEYSSESQDRIVFGQTRSNISLGFKRRVSANSVYKTTKYGTVTNSLEKYISADLLIGLPSELPVFYAYNYNNPTYPNEVSSVSPVTTLTATSIEESYKMLPIGIRAEYKQNTRDAASFGWNISGGVFPGHYSSIVSLIALKIGVTYNFLYKI